MGNIDESVINQLVNRLLAGDMLATAKLISIAENTDLNERIIKLITPHLGRAKIIGITGAPGVGKSTLTDKMVKYYRDREKKIGIVAVDPTSPFSGGAILGDRIRLQKFADDDKVFIRSMATRGHLGGISPATADTVRILDAFGCDYIFIETVGVGQSEIEIVKNVDATLLVLVPGMGDDIQAIKAGIMEIADIFVVNKADKDGLERTVMEVEMLQDLAETKGWKPPINKVIARDNVGVEKLCEKVEEYIRYLTEQQLLEKIRKDRLETELKHITHNKLLKQAKYHLQNNENIQTDLEKIYRHDIDIYSVANKIVQSIVK